MTADPSALRILVTGGAGFIGSHLCDKLLSQGHVVCALDNLQTGSLGNLSAALANPRFDFIEANVQTPLLERPFDQIYNLACPASPPQYQRDPVATMRTSILGAINVLDHARRWGTRVLQASTSEVYGDPDVHPQPEHYVGAVNCAGRRACYDEGKRAAETLFYDYHRQYSIEIRVARIFNTYGPRMSPEDGRVIPNFLTQALSGAPLSMFGDGLQTRSFCYVDDTIDALIRLMAAPGGRIGPINIGNPTEFTVRELADLVLARTGSGSLLAMHPLPEDDPKIRRPDISEAMARLGWAPTIELTQGLDLTIAAYRASQAATAAATVPALKIASDRLVIIGGGPAGLTAAYEMSKLSPERLIVVLEASNQVGGIARTEVYKGFRFDIGGHRFFTKVSEVEALWQEVGGADFVTRPRLSRIHYRDRFYAYPLKIGNALSNMGVYESVRIGLSYVRWKMRPSRVEENLEQWVTNRFGSRLFTHFFKTYTEKVWGIPCTEIQADWAAQRIKNLSLRKAVVNAITGANDTASLIEEFQYPRLGPGMMWESFCNRVTTSGHDVRMNSRVERIHCDGRRVLSVDVAEGDGQATVSLSGKDFISSMPLRELVHAMTPPAPTAVRAAADALRYRDFLIVVLILDHADPFPDNWIYIHSPDVRVGRIQNFRAWSQDMVPDTTKASIGMEYFCDIGSDLWQMSRDELVAFAATELDRLKLAKASSVIDGTVIRQPQAYPVYDSGYRAALDIIRDWLAGIENLQVVGRNGMHRYNNQDHSMLTAMLAVRNILGESHDLWNVNVERSYHEEFQRPPKSITA